MDSALAREREAFKRKLISTPVVDSRKKRDDGDSGPSKKKAKVEKATLAAPPPPPKVRESVGAMSKDPFAYKSMTGTSQYNFSVLAKIVKHMKQQHLAGDSEPRTLDEILDETNQLDIGQRQKTWLETEALAANPKIECTPDNKYVFKPTFKIKDRKGLLRLLDKYDRDGKGGISIEDIQESLPNAEKAMRVLGDSIVVITRPMDKKKIVFYNDKGVQIKIDDDFQKQWRSASVEGIDEQKIDEYLQKHGIATMADVGRKITPVQRRKKPASRKGKQFKKTNQHVADDLQDYSDRQ